MHKKPQMNKGALTRAIKKLFGYYPRLAPLTMLCILFSSVVSSIPSLFVQNILSIIEKWYLSRDWVAAKAEIMPYKLLYAVRAVAASMTLYWPAHGIYSAGLSKSCARSS